MNLLHKVLYFVLNHKNLVIYLNKTYFGSKIVQDILFFVYIKNSLWKLSCHRSLILKSIQKTAYLSRVSLQYIKRNTFQFYKVYFLFFTI